jgi:hypothetical protein
MEPRLKVNLYKIIFIIDETIPIRFFLSPYGLNPTQNNVNNRYSTNYYLNLVLLDVEERRYFKQHEIVMVRLEKKKKGTTNK